MAFKTRISRRAKSDVREAVTFIREGSEEAARRWRLGLGEAIARLKSHPESYALIPESEWLSDAYGAIHHHSHRVIYRIDEVNRIVHIVRVYHGARRPLSVDEVE